ncbi:alpha/beta hydrolase [Ulvibacter antarcticus]|uniref:Pimeloyl-ACP methyl ester carboxylesterase n=1 Tax=Ulvibacter antarcticus TaxID=442714 RepID=A0A3L9Z2W9_9FLAO|nr:alpha/beta hydrolase [Ulvibacter antarcticus]RMA64645.1 pimeloyl-ACP methyl ester carboxylesterase [Ulvibacter antarcticus]
MVQEKVHIYLVPGMAAGKEIFRNIALPLEKYEIHILEWLIPNKSETLSNYAVRMAARITEPNAVLIGVSFGGVVVQEMSAFLELKKLIIVSSVKSRREMPRRLRYLNRTRMYKLAPTRFVLSAKDLSKLAVGPRSEKRLKLYDQYLHVRDKRYLDWAIKNMVSWNRVEADPKVHHIHGNKDGVFPIRYITNCTVIEGGTHIMLLNKGKEISEKLLEIMANN